MQKYTIKELRKALMDYYGKDWWNDVLKWLKEELDFPKLYDIPKHLKDDFHPVFRDKVNSIFKITNEESASNRLTAYSRMDLLKNMRPSLLPHWLGILCPVFRSRSINNFGLVTMKVEKGDIFSRAFYNLPFPFDQKVKRTVISCYGLAKHGRKIEDIDKYPDGGVFLLNPDKDEKYESFAKYTDYAYVTLRARLPIDYDEYIKTLDGSVLISKAAAKKLRYRRVAYAIITNPSNKITTKKWLIFDTKEPKIGAKVDYQEELTDVDSDLARLSSIHGTITEVKLLTPWIKEPERRVWWVKIEDERDAEIGCKLENPCGLKHTVAGYTKYENDGEAVIVINPDAFKDRAIYREIMETGKVHVYPTIPGIDGNVSTRNIRISRTLVQGIFCYPPKVQEKLIEALFNKDTLIYPFPKDILKILENMHKIDPDKLVKKYPVFHNYLFYTRKKEVKGKLYFYVEPTKLYRAWKKLNKAKDFNKLGRFDREAINSFVRQMVQSLLLFDNEKKCKIKIRGYIRIALFHSDPEVNVIHMGKSLWKDLGEPGYVLVAKEPVTRDTSIRCLKVKVKSDDEVPPWVVYVHPYLAMDHENPAPENFNTKLDSVKGDTPVWVMDENGNIECVPIASLLPEPVEDLERVPVNKYIYTAQGWVPIAYVYRHKVKKKGYRIRTNTGFVEVTDDHSLIVNDVKVRPSELGDNVEIVKVPLPENGEFRDPELAWVYGLFLAEGNCNVEYGVNMKYKKSNVRIQMLDKKPLEKAAKILEKHGYKPKIYLDKSKSKQKKKEVWSLLITQSKKEAKKWRDWFYIGKEKKVPSFILSAPKDVKEAFIEGLIVGDGHRYENGKIEINTIHKHVANAVQRILEDLGYVVSLAPDKSTDKKFGNKWVWKVRTLPSGRKRYPEEKILEKEEIYFDNEYVYDICTYAGEFVGFNIRLKQTDGDLLLVMPLKEKIPEAMHKVKKRKYDKLWSEAKKLTLKDVKHFEPYNDIKDFLIDVYEYNRRESIEQLIMQQFGGIKNRAMFTPLIEDWRKWKEFVNYWDLELKGFQAEKFNPELKNATPKELNEFYTKMLKEAQSAKLPDYIEEYKQLRELEKITYPEIKKVRQVLKSLKKSKHPVIKLMARIYEILEIV